MRGPRPAARRSQPSCGRDVPRTLAGRALKSAYFRGRELPVPRIVGAPALAPFGGFPHGGEQPLTEFLKRGFMVLPYQHPIERLYAPEDIADVEPRGRLGPRHRPGEVHRRPHVRVVHREDTPTHLHLRAAPRIAISRSLFRASPNLRYVPRGRPVSEQRLRSRTGDESRGSFCSFSRAS